MKIYIVDCDVEWDLRYEERLNPFLPTTFTEYEVRVDETKGQELKSQIIYQLEDEYNESINGVAYDVLEEKEV